MGFTAFQRLFMTAHIQSTIPVLASLHIGQTLTFYMDKLGFSKRLEMDSYAIVSRDGAEIHFWLCSDPHIAQNTSCYMRVQDTHSLYQEFRFKGVEVTPPADQPWGMRELYVHDTHGNLLKFGEAV